MAGNGNHTYIDPETVRSVAGHLGGLMDDLEPFRRLVAVETKAGNFEAAAWLEKLVHERQAGLLQHAEDLRTVLGDLKASLGEVSQSLEETDRQNGSALGRPAIAR